MRARRSLLIFACFAYVVVLANAIRCGTGSLNLKLCLCADSVQCAASVPSVTVATERRACVVGVSTAREAAALICARLVLANCTRSAGRRSSFAVSAGGAAGACHVLDFVLTRIANLACESTLFPRAGGAGCARASIGATTASANSASSAWSARLASCLARLVLEGMLRRGAGRDSWCAVAL